MKKLLLATVASIVLGVGFFVSTPTHSAEASEISGNATINGTMFVSIKKSFDMDDYPEPPQTYYYNDGRYSGVLYAEDWFAINDN